MTRRAADGLPDWLADPHLATAWARVRARFESEGLVARGRTVVPLTTRQERHAVGALLGRVITQPRVTVDLAALDARLRKRWHAGGLRAALPLVTGGPLVDRPAMRTQAVARREAPLELARELVAEPWAEEWVAGLRSAGTLTSRPDALEIVRQAAAALLRLTGSAGARAWSRVELAAEVVGDAHALDDDRPLSQLVLRGLAAARRLPAPVSAHDRRQLWESYGVAPDQVSRTCLVLGLRPGGEEPAAERLRIAAAAGDPVHVTAWDLRRLPGDWPRATSSSGPVLVCENPRVLEAVAERHGGRVPVVCAAGEPNTVVTDLLARLRDAGHPLRYHGDFDWAGVAIANRVVERFGAVPWRMGAKDYQSAVRPDGPELGGIPVEPSWDKELGAAMRSAGRAVHEEAVLSELLDTLCESSE